MVTWGVDLEGATTAMVVRFRRVPGGVTVRRSSLAMPDIEQGLSPRLPLTAPADDALLATTGVRVKRLAFASVRWPWLTLHRAGWLMGWAAFAVVILLSALTREPADLVGFGIPAALVTVLLYFNMRDTWTPRTARVLVDGQVLTVADAIRRLEEIDGGPTPADRVSVVMETYGALLGDVVYRIENSALFDAALPTTQRFQVALVSWDPDSPDAAELATEIEDSFRTARTHAEQVGLAHLPSTAREPARRAARGAALALASDNPAERETAARTAAALLRSIALYYLPTIDPTTPPLIAARRQLTP